MARGLWKPVHWFVLTQPLFFVAAILIGTLYPAEVSPHTGFLHEAHYQAETALYVLFYGSLVSSAFWIWRMKGFRLFAVCLLAVFECFIAAGFFISLMAVIGDWL